MGIRLAGIGGPDLWKWYPELLESFIGAFDSRPEGESLLIILDWIQENIYDTQNGNAVFVSHGRRIFGATSEILAYRNLAAENRQNPTGDRCWRRFSTSRNIDGCG